jgi:hypothetical protein
MTPSKPALFLLAVLLAPLPYPAPPAAAALQLPQTPAACVQWAAQDVAAALQEARADSGADVQLEIRPGKELPPEGFALTVSGQTVRLIGGDEVGAMYGLLELAEQIRNGGAHDQWSAVAATLHSTTQRPFLEFRAVNAFIHATDRSLRFDVPMWKAYIDQLARARFNVLDLHGGYDLRTTRFPNLYPLLVHVPDYPNVGDPEQQLQNLADFKAIVRYASSRGMRVAFMNYSVGGLAPRDDTLADYTAKAVAELLRQAPELSMLGFRIGETGQSADFFQRAYLQGVALSGRKDIRLYTRSWLTTRDQLETVGRATRGRFGIEIKYNGEQLGLPYQAIGKGGHSYSYQGYVKANAPYQIIWQVRANGTHRFWAWAGADFIRRAVQSFTLGRALGFTLEPDVAYFPLDAASYYRSPADQRVYRYIWQKYWMWDFMWGRLSYDPQLPEATLIAAFRQHFGAAGTAIYAAMQAASPIVPLVCAYRYQGPDQRDWSPETETGCLANRGRSWTRLTLAARAALIGVGRPGSFDALSFSMHPPMDPSAFAGIRDFVHARLKGQPEGRVGPAWVARLLTDAADATRAAVDHVGTVDGPAGTQRSWVGAAGWGDEWRLLKTDLLCSADLGDYYAARILGVTHLFYATLTGNAPDYEQAVRYLAQSRERWKALAENADAVFAPLDNRLRHEPQFQWSQPLPALEKTDATAPVLWAAAHPHPGAPPLRFTPAEVGADPGIEVTEVRHQLQSGRVTVTCHVTAKEGVKTVWLWYRDLPSESVWQQATMSRGGDEFSAVAPITPAGLMYYIEVEDGKGEARDFPDVLQATPRWVIDPWEVQGGVTTRIPGAD